MEETARENDEHGDDEGDEDGDDHDSELGMKFHSLDIFKYAIREYNINLGRDVRFKKPDAEKACSISTLIATHCDIRELVKTT
ncbi:hypothetical protein CRG98_002918 [Punica granatum]|uniref:Transposase MuDR plant domain-containing protein n=1 Tax=Punica granatum TaxID=22663 RepID=A0A2I0L7C1_PUNGR|nr:hypothetical protein CRG98_002918 [Punica granatum]